MGVASHEVSMIEENERQEPLGALSFEAFFRSQLHQLVALAYGLSGSRPLAEDLAQEALMAAYRNWDRVSVLDNPATWVRRVVVNRSVSSFRRRVVETAALSTRLRVRDDGASNIGPMPAEDEHVWTAIRALPRRQAQVITLRILDRSTVGEIANVLGLSEEAASTHLRRARQTLARHLTKGDLR
jgi:RNA polymerase sigma factor (sigma-70 family)